MSDKRVESALEGELLQGHFLVERRHAKGGMAWIYQALDQRSQGPVALKIMFAKWRKDAKTYDRFLQEMRVHSQLKHPNVVNVIDYIDDGQLMGMAMEWVEGGDLKELLESREGPLETTEIEEIFLPLLDAMAYAHEQQIVHRDIKPGNVLLARENGRFVPKMTDFGIAKILVEPGGTFTGAKLGTPHYMAPEQWRDSKNVDHRADIYSLGVILYRLVTGRLPFDGDYQTIIVKLLEEPAPYPTGVAAPLAGVILRCLEKDPAERIDSCRALSGMLRRALAMQAPASRPGAETLPMIAFAPNLASSGLGDMPTDATIPEALAVAADSSLLPETPSARMSGATAGAALSDFHQTAAWGQEEVEAALDKEQLDMLKSLEKAAEAERLAHEASLKTMAIDADDPIFRQLQKEHDEALSAAATARPLPFWVLLLLGLGMLLIGGLIGWYFSRGGMP